MIAKGLSLLRTVSDRDRLVTVNNKGIETMKSKGQGKKEWVVMQFDDYANQWRQWSIPVTIKQAYYILARTNPKYYKIAELKNEI